MTDSTPDLESTDIGDVWTVGDAVVNSLPMIIRLRQNLEPVIGHPRLPHRLRILWEYTPESEFGLPAIADMQLMDACENALVREFESDRLGIMTHILTGDSLRQWIFYVQDLEQSVERVQAVMATDLITPLEATAVEDAPWQEYIDTAQQLNAHEPPSA